MSDVDLNSEPLIKPFPSALRLHYMGSYVLPVVIYCIILVYINELTFEGLIVVLKNPVAGATIVFTDFLMPTLMYNYFTKRIRMYDGTEESLRRTNKYIKDLEMFHLVWVFMNLFISTISPILICRSIGMPLDPLAIIFTASGCVALFGFLPMIIFVEGYEGHLSDISFKFKERTSSFVLRNVLITGLAAIGLMAYIIAPVFVAANRNLPASELFLLKILPVSLVAIVLAVIDTSLLQNSVRKRLRPMTDFMVSLAHERDYTQESLVVESRDEVGYLKQSINEFYEVTRKLLLAMEDSISESRHSAEVLASDMTETASSITQITANIDSVKTRVINQSAGVEETDATIKSMVSKIQMLTESIEQQSSDIETSSSAIEEMVANIRSVSDILAKNTVAVNQLTAASDNGRAKVEQAVEQAKTILEDSAGLLEASDIIQNIAEQTNLLAMNAAIEAAHAGEAGKGFAVVSDEIRKLAEQSNTQGKTISTQLENLQQSIENITNATKEVQEQFSIIYNLADNVKNQEIVVENAMQEQRAGSDQILDAIKNMRESTRILKNGAEELESGSKEVSSDMRTLSNVTEEISGAMAEISNVTDLIVTSSAEVNSTSEENYENLNSLSNEMSKFRVSKEN